MVSSWRNRLALWCLRILTPEGVLVGDMLAMKFDSGDSIPADPKLVMRLRNVETDQLVISVVLDADTIVDTVARNVDGLRDWAKEYSNG